MEKFRDNRYLLHDIHREINLIAIFDFLIMIKLWNNFIFAVLSQRMQRVNTFLR